MGILVGSARHDEHGKYTGGSAGDQLQKSSNGDMSGEVSMQSMYVHSKGWYILRPKSAQIAEKLASAMKQACNNKNIGYDQNQRFGILSYGTGSKTKTECDCSSLVRQCVKEASGKDPGNFNTSTEKSVLLRSGLFTDAGTYRSQSATPVYNGDVLVTKSKGHTVIVVSGSARSTGSGSGSTNTGSSGTTYKGSFPVLPPRGYFKYGDGISQLTNYTTQIKRLQTLLNWAINAGLTVDGMIGSGSQAAIKSFQKQYGLTVDGLFGEKCLAKAKTIRK